MGTSAFGDYLSSIEKIDLGFKTDNLALIKINDDAFPGLITDITISRDERIQPVQCFNDKTHIFMFGSNPGMGKIQGFALAGDDSLTTLIDYYKKDARAYLGGPFSVNIVRGEVINGLLTGFTYNIKAETPTIGFFVISFIVLEPGDTAFSGNQNVNFFI